MTRKPTISIDDGRITENFLAHPFVETKHQLAAYAEMATDQDREADAEQWLGAFSVNTPLAKAWLSGSR